MPLIEMLAVVAVLTNQMATGATGLPLQNNLSDDPTIYAKIIRSFPNKSESDLIDIRNKLKSLNSDVLSDQPASTVSTNVMRDPVYDSVLGTPSSISVINKDIADFLYQSDLLLTPQQLNELISIHRKKREVTSNPWAKWPTKAKGVIPYFLRSDLTSDQISAIQAAIKFWEDNACLQFQLNGTGFNSLLFINGAGCYSNIGLIGGQQIISIGNGCQYMAIAAHEIAHALGFYHEQSRYDRDDYVTINTENILPSQISNFDKALPSQMNLYNITYDYGSVMHYDSEAFAMHSTIPTITTTDPRYQQTIGQRRAPSFLDVLTMNRHYGCDALCASSTIVCKNGGFVDPNNCNQCICPASFGGTLCDALAPAENGVCGESLTATTTWQSFSSAVGTTITTDTPTTCYWQLNSPAGTQMEIKLTLSPPTYCIPGCFWNSVEIKLDSNYQRSGIRYCCLYDYSSTPFVSSSNLVPIIAYGNYQTVFKIEYRYVANMTTTTASVATETTSTTKISTITSTTTMTVPTTTSTSTTTAPTTTSTPTTNAPTTTATTTTKAPTTTLTTTTMTNDSIATSSMMTNDPTTIFETTTNAPTSTSTTTNAFTPTNTSSPAPLKPDHWIGPDDRPQGDYLQSENGLYRAVMESGGNFVVYRGEFVVSNELWNTFTSGKGSPSYHLAIKGDNNLVVYDLWGTALWSSNTSNKGTKPARLVMQNDGNLVLYDGSSQPLWTSLFVVDRFIYG